MCNSPKEHIGQIRQEFGIKDRKSKALHNATEQLAEGLYSKDIHFILELIQNAEDNEYSETVQPEVEFIILEDDPTHTHDAHGALLLINNERGFLPEHVEALCNVGGSTKLKRDGYIGEKGIGFKSVFIVSRRPHIFSNGYRFYFDETPDSEAGFGYIIPYWAEEIPPEISNKQANTTILLPLKHEKRQEVIEQIQTIAPETILFLSKLQSLAIKNHHDVLLSVLRDDRKKPFIEFMVQTPSKEKEDYAEFFVIEKIFQVPEDVCEEKRTAISERKVSIAFPLTDNFQAKNNVFAFLPVEDVQSGFPFLLNADFILSSSRETIQIDRPWNRWLRDCIAPTFVKAFQTLLENPDYRCKAYAYIPLAHDVLHEFFESVPETIYRLLREQEVVFPFIGEKLVIPATARLATPAFCALIENAQGIPEQLRQTPLVHSEIQCYKKQLKVIGVKELSEQEIFECLKDDGWLQQQNFDWIIQLYEYLCGYSWSRKELLREMNIIPSENGELSNTKTQPIYFPKKDIHEIVQSHFQTSFFQLTFLSAKFYDKIKENQKITGWLEEISGVRILTQAHYYLEVVKAFNDHRDQISESDLIGLTIQIRDHYDDFDTNTKMDIKQYLPLLLADNSIISPNKWNEKHPLVTPERLNPETGWQHVFTEPQDRSHMNILSDKYLDNCSDAKDLEKWKIFFKEIGATDTPLSQYIVGDFYESKMLTSYEKKLFKCFRERFKRENPKSRNWPKKEILSNYRSPHWLRALKIDTASLQNQTLHNQSRALIQWLHSIPGFYEFEYAFYHGSYKNLFCYSNDSEFKYFLINTSWFPTTKGFKKPNEVFVNKPELRELFGDALPYAAQDVNEDVAAWLGLRQSATFRELLVYLQDMAKRPASEATPATIEKIYRFFSERWPNSAEEQQNVKKVFEEHALILVKTPEKCWIKKEQAIWRDLSDVFGDTYVYLTQQQYPARLEEFFVKQLGIPEKLDEKLYADALEQLSQKSNERPEAIEAALERIYPALLKVAKNPQYPSWWPSFCRNAKIWTQSDHFRYAVCVYIPDDGDLKKIFAEEDVDFAWCPAKASCFADYKDLYQALQVKSLRDSIKITAEIGQTAYIPEHSTPLLTAATKKAVCFFLRNELPAAYEKMKGNGRLATFLETQEQFVGKLSLQYKLDDVETEVEDGIAYWDIEKKRLYISCSYDPEQAGIEIATMLARQLTDGQAYTQLENFIGRMLRASDKKFELIRQKHNWTLTEEDKQWMEKTLTLTGEITKDPPNFSGNAEDDDLHQGEDGDEHSSDNAIGSHAENDEDISTQADEKHFSYADELQRAFNRQRKSQSDCEDFIPPGPLPDPQRRKDRVGEEIHKSKNTGLPDEERYRKVLVKRWEPKDESIRTFLAQQYNGVCQICGYTFIQRNGEPYFEGLYLVSRTQADWIEQRGNILCLCANCCAKLLHGQSSAEDIVDQILSHKSGNAVIPFELCGERVELKFSERHILDLQTLLKVDMGE